MIIKEFYIRMLQEAGIDLIKLSEQVEQENFIFLLEHLEEHGLLSGDLRERKKGGSLSYDLEEVVLTRKGMEHLYRELKGDNVGFIRHRHRELLRKGIKNKLLEEFPKVFDALVKSLKEGATLKITYAEGYEEYSYVHWLYSHYKSTAGIKLLGDGEFKKRLSFFLEFAEEMRLASKEGKEIMLIKA